MLYARCDIRTLCDCKHYRSVLKQCSSLPLCGSHEVLETESKVFLVMEYVPGGELYDYIRTRERVLLPLLCPASRASVGSL